MQYEKTLYRNLQDSPILVNFQKLNCDLDSSIDIVNELRRHNYGIDGALINQMQYCKALIHALNEKYIENIDEFAFLYLKVCLACDYKTVVTTNSFSKNCAIDPVFLKNCLLRADIPSYGFDYITFNIQAEEFHKNKLVTYEMFENTSGSVIPIHQSNIPLSDYIKLDNCTYQIRVSSFILIKQYLSTYYWLPDFKYRFGISNKDDIALALQDPDTMGRDINLWCPYEGHYNYTKIHNYMATSSIVTLHDLIHISILSSYPKNFVNFLYKNIALLTDNFSKADRWNEPSLLWKLIDFSVSHEGEVYDGDITKLLSIYIRKACISWFKKITEARTLDEKNKLMSYYFHDLIICLKEGELIGFDAEKLVYYLDM